MQRHMPRLFALLGIAVFAAVPAMADSSGYKLIKTIHLPGNQGGHGDWTTFDPATGTVWLSQSPDHNVVVLDAASLSVKHVIPGIKDGNGIALTPAYAFLSDNGSDVTVVVDKNTFEKIATLTPQGKGPNGTVFDPKTDTVLVTTDSNDATVFSAQKPFTVLGHFRLQPDPAKDGPDVGLYVPSLDRVYQPVDNAVQRGFYARALDEWLRHFERDQLLILQYERCAEDPATQLRATFSFLGLPETAPALTPVPGAGSPEGDPVDDDVARRLVAIYEKDVLRLAASEPTIDLTRWPHFAHLAGGSPVA